MSSSVATATASAASLAKTNHPWLYWHGPAPIASHSPSNSNNNKVSFRLSHKPLLRLRFCSKTRSGRPATAVRAQLNEIVGGGSSIAAAPPPAKAEPEARPSAVEAKDANPSTEPSPAAASASEESISAFIAQVPSLLKLVDSRDIVELQLKHLDCQLLIRKKEAMPQPPAQAVMKQQPHQLAVASSAFQAGPPAASAAPSVPAPSASPPSASAAKSARSSLPAFKCPMAGTFYSSLAPGEPPFVKVGDKVKKGRVLCIIEAMKLMNSIEADQSGTIVDILVEDGKPVSIDAPLFVIEP